MSNKKLWTVEVIETRAIDCIYRVEADNIREARTLAEQGDTITSDDIKTRGVVNRDVWSDPEAIDITIPPMETKRDRVKDLLREALSPNFLRDARKAGVRREADESNTHEMACDLADAIFNTLGISEGEQDTQ